MSDQPRPGPEPTRRVIELWQEPNQRWRWRYLEPSSDSRPRAFTSNKEYDSRQAALASATTAYPGVLVRQPPADGSGRGRGRLRDRLRLLVLLGLVLLVLWPRRRRRRQR